MLSISFARLLFQSLTVLTNIIERTTMIMTATLKPQHGFSALHVAAWRGHTSVVEMLVKEGADVVATTIVSSKPSFSYINVYIHSCLSYLLLEFFFLRFLFLLFPWAFILLFVCLPSLLSFGHRVGRQQCSWLRKKVTMRQLQFFKQQPSGYVCVTYTHSYHHV